MAKVTGVIVVKVRLLWWLNTKPTALKTGEYHEEKAGVSLKYPQAGA